MEEDSTEKLDEDLIEQMNTMEIMKTDSEVNIPLNSEMTTVEEIPGETEEITEAFDNFETTTVIATSISTSEAISYYSSASLPASDS